MRILNTHTRGLYLQLIYFLNAISFWFVECLFLIDGTLALANYFQGVTEFTLRFLYRLNQPLWKIHGIASINFNCFTIDESNQVKISREIMRCQGYFFKIALGTRLQKTTTSRFKTKKPRHRDFKTKKPPHRDSGTKTPRHREMEITKPRHRDSKAFFQMTKSDDIEIPRLKNHDIEIPIPKSHDIEFLWYSDPSAP